MKKKVAKIALALILVLFVLVAVLSAMSKKAHAAEFGTVECQDGFRVVAHAWSLEKIPADLRERAEELITAAHSRDTKGATDIKAYKADDISRTLGGPLRRAKIPHASVKTDIQVRLLNPETLTAETNMQMSVSDGIGGIKLSGEQRTKIVEIIWPANFISPTVSGGAKRLRLFPNEWGKWCTMNVHGLVP